MPGDAISTVATGRFARRKLPSPRSALIFNNLREIESEGCDCRMLAFTILGGRYGSVLQVDLALKQSSHWHLNVNRSYLGEANPAATRLHRSDYGPILYRKITSLSIPREGFEQLKDVFPQGPALMLRGVSFPV